MPEHLASSEFGVQASKITTVNRALLQLGLYEVMLNQPASGLGQTPFRGREVVLFVSRIPNLVPADPALRASIYFAHQFGICLLAILVACQAVTALYYHVIPRDERLASSLINGSLETSRPVPGRAGR